MAERLPNLAAIFGGDRKIARNFDEIRSFFKRWSDGLLSFSGKSVVATGAVTGETVNAVGVMNAGTASIGGLQGKTFIDSAGGLGFSGKGGLACAQMSITGQPTATLSTSYTRIVNPNISEILPKRGMSISVADASMTALVSGLFLVSGRMQIYEPNAPSPSFIYDAAIGYRAAGTSPFVAPPAGTTGLSEVGAVFHAGSYLNMQLGPSLINLEAGDSIGLMYKTPDYTATAGVNAPVINTGFLTAVQIAGPNLP